MEAQRPRIAAIVTEYRPLSHADVIVTRLLEGYDLFWTPRRPRTEVAALYTDQVPANDISREIAGRHGVPIFPTIREALNLGGQAEPLAIAFLQHRLLPHGNFGHQALFIEELVETGRAAYPVERTLLTTGIREAAMISHHEGGRRVETPHLDVVYRPAMPASAGGTDG